MLALLGVVGIASVSAVANQPGTPPKTSIVELLWGKPDPRVVNRIISPLGALPAGLVETEVLAYENVEDDLPDYYARLKEFLYLGSDEIPGYVGTVPDFGNGAFDFAELVINVRGPILCVPRAVVMIETPEAVQLAVYYGLPDPADGSTPDNVTQCATDSAVTGSVLIPIALQTPLGERAVQHLDGSPIREVFSREE